MDQTKHRAATEKRRRIDGYIRVSRVGKRRGASFISPDVQRDAILEWAGRNGVEIVEMFEELDESGARADRPLLQRAIERIEAGASSGLAVYRVNRFGRSLVDGVQAIERVRAAGGSFYSVQDGLDTNTDAGGLVLQILLSVAEFQLNGIRADWDAARERAIRRGVQVTHSTPVGYRRTRSGRLRPHPVNGPLMTEAFRRRAEGASLRELGAFLEEHEVLTGKGNPGWSTSAVSHALRSRTYLGEVRSGRHVNTGAHPALTDAGTWQAAQHPAFQRVHTTIPALLVGLARCAGCSHSLGPFIARPPGKTPTLHYRCRKFHAAGTCPSPAIITATKLEPFVIDQAMRILHTRRRPPLGSLRLAEAAQDQAVQDLARYRDNDRVAATIGDAAYLQGLEVRSRRIAEANLQVMDSRARVELHNLPSLVDARAILAAGTLNERRELIRAVIAAVFVRQGRGTAADRVMVCPPGTAPRRLPRQGSRGRVMEPVKPRRGWLPAA